MSNKIFRLKICIEVKRAKYQFVSVVLSGLWPVIFSINAQIRNIAMIKIITNKIKLVTSLISFIFIIFLLKDKLPIVQISQVAPNRVV